MLAFDNDPASIAATAENARRNGVSLDTRRHDLRSGAMPTAGTVAANRPPAPLLLSLATRLPAEQGLPAQLIAAGVLHAEADEIAAGFAARGLLETRRRSLGDWTGLLLQRRDDVDGQPGPQAASRRGQPADENLGHAADVFAGLDVPLRGAGQANHGW